MATPQAQKSVPQSAPQPAPRSEADISAVREREIAQMVEEEGLDGESAEDGLDADDLANDQIDDEGAPETAQEAPPQPQEQQPRLSPQELAERVRQADLGRTEARREAQAYRAQIEQMEQAFQEVVRRAQYQQQPQQQQVTDPTDPNFDPVTFFQTKTQTLEQQVGALTQHLQAQAIQQQQAAELNQVLTTADQSEQEFVARTPDYYDALKHLRRSHIQELQFAFPDATREQIFDTLNNDEIQLARRAQQLGRKPAEFVYEIAKYRGYQQQPQRQNGSTGYSSNMERLQQGMQAARTLSSFRGEGNQNEMTLERLSTLKGAAFDQAWAKLKREGAFRR